MDDGKPPRTIAECEREIVRVALALYDAHVEDGNEGAAFAAFLEAIENYDARRARYAHTRRPPPPGGERCKGRTMAGARCLHRRERTPRADGKHCAHHRQWHPRKP